MSNWGGSELKGGMIYVVSMWALQTDFAEFAKKKKSYKKALFTCEPISHFYMTTIFIGSTLIHAIIWGCGEGRVGVREEGLSMDYGCPTNQHSNH